MQRPLQFLCLSLVMTCCAGLAQAQPHTTPTPAYSASPGYAPSAPPPGYSQAGPPSGARPYAQAQGSYAGNQATNTENCGTPDEPKPCPPMPRVPLPYYPANK
jgi:hypothetical protein